MAEDVGRVFLVAGAAADADQFISAGGVRGRVCRRFANPSLHASDLRWQFGDGMPSEILLGAVLGLLEALLVARDCVGQGDVGGLVRGDDSGLGIGHVLAADVISAADGGFAEQLLGDEKGLGLAEAVENLNPDTCANA